MWTSRRGLVQTGPVPWGYGKMNPQNYMLGIRDVFAVLVPGAALLLLLDIADIVRGYPDGIGFLAFAIVAYLVGSVAFTLGGFVDPVAVEIIRRSLRRRPNAPGREQSSALGRTRHQERYAKALKGLILASATVAGERIEAPKMGHTKGFWWDQLRLNCPPAIAELDRLESIQKLFRSLFVVLVAAALIHILLTSFDPGAHSPVAHPSAVLRQPDFPVYAIPTALLCFALYVWARWRFDAAVYRLAAAFMLSPHTFAVASRNLPSSAQDETPAGGEA